MSAPTLTAADYSDWCRFAGLYLDNISHADRYRTYQQKISSAGLVTKIVFDFLDSNPGGIDLQVWRNSYVYEMGSTAAVRIEQTAVALEALGAPRIAAKMRTLRDTSLGGMLRESAGNPELLQEFMKKADAAKLMEEFRANVGRAMPHLAAEAGLPVPEKKPVPPAEDIESWEQIEHLLGVYVQAHEQTLRADIAKYGDVRAEPGFDPDQRLAELDRLRRAQYDREAQKEDVHKMDELMERIDKHLAQNPNIKPGKIASLRRKFLGCYRKYSRRPADELLPDTQQCLQKAERFQAKYAAVFRPPPIDDEALLKRLAVLGTYEVDMDNKRVSLSWESPAGLASDWTVYSLAMHYRVDDKRSLRALLDACDRLQKRFAQHQFELRQEILEHFEMQRADIERFQGFDDYVLGDDGKPSEESILRHAGGGKILLSLAGDDDAAIIQVFFGVDWDEEHLLELSLTDEPDREPASEPAAAANVRFYDAGPPISMDVIAKFEKEHDVKLPADYRQFLLRQNGGRPEPNHLKVKLDGGTTPVYVECLYCVDVDQKQQNSLGDAIDLHRANDLPAAYAPIGRVRIANPGGSPMRTDLLIALSGRKQGKILLALPVEMLLSGLEESYAAKMFETCCRRVAPSLAALLSRLTPAQSGR
jgi:SMI1-KNR4 cell-wall